MSVEGVLINVAYHNHPYQNKDAFGNGVNYACRANRDAADLVRYKLFGMPNDEPLENQIEEVHMIQRLHDIDSRGGRRAAHMVFSIQESTFCECGCNPELVAMAFEQMGRTIFNEGYQVCVGTHYNSNNKKQDGAFMHAHIVVNSVSYIDGRKFHMTKAECLETQEKFNGILGACQQMSPVLFKDMDYFRKTNPQYRALNPRSGEE